MKNKERETALRKLYEGSSTMFGICAAFYVASGYLITQYEILGKILAVVGLIVFGLSCYRTYDEIKQNSKEMKTLPKKETVKFVGGILFFAVIWPNMVRFPKLLAILLTGWGCGFTLRFLLNSKFPKEREG